MPDLDLRLQRLLDENDIRNLTSRYCLYIWTRDIRVVELYSEDGEFGTSGPGHEAVRATYARIFDRPANILGLPYIHNHVIEFDGPDRARGFCALDLRRATPEGKAAFSASYYDDEYVRMDGVWKFRSRQAHNVLSAAIADTLTSLSSEHLGLRPVG